MIRARKLQAGFTLIELLLVIAILAILAAIVVFAVSGLTDRGVRSACVTDVRTVETAQLAYYTSHDETYASDKETLVSDGLLRDVAASLEYTVTTDATGAIYVDGAPFQTAADCPA